MNISATTTMTSAKETPLRSPTNVCGRDFDQGHLEQDAGRRRAHDLRCKETGLARVHHPVGDVEEDHQRRTEGGDQDLGLVADPEDHEKEREHRRGGRRAKEIDHEFHRAVELRPGAQHDPQRDGDRHGDQGREDGALDCAQEIESRVPSAKPFTSALDASSGEGSSTGSTSRAAIAAYQSVIKATTPTIGSIASLRAMRQAVHGLRTSC